MARTVNQACSPVFIFSSHQYHKSHTQLSITKLEVLNTQPRQFTPRINRSIYMYTLLTSFGCIKGLFNLKNAALLNPTLTGKLYWSFIYFLPYIFWTKFIKHQITGHLFIFYCTFFREFVNISKSCLHPLIRNSYPLRKHVLWKLKIPITSEQAQAKWSLIAKKLTENGFCSFCDWLPNLLGL